jgi:APA family basic amino acid/polyamine antiporter
LRAAAVALAALWTCTLVNIAGLREAGYVQVVATLLKLVPLVLFGLLGLFWVRMSSYVPFNPSGAPLFATTTAVAALTLWAFLGFEAATIPAGSIRDPERNVPRATVIGMLVAGLATMLSCTVVLGLLPADVLQHSAAPMADAARSLWGTPAGIAVGVVATVSCFGALNGWVMLQAQVPMAAAQDGLFPRAFGRLNARGAPAFGLLLSSGLATLLVVSNYNRTLVGLFAFSILLSTAAALLPYGVSVAAWLRRHRRAAHWRQLVAIGALLYSAWALWGTGLESLAWGAVLLVAGVPVYYASRRR